MTLSYLRSLHHRTTALARSQSHPSPLLVLHLPPQQSHVVPRVSHVHPQNPAPALFQASILAPSPVYLALYQADFLPALFSPAHPVVVAPKTSSVCPQSQRVKKKRTRRSRKLPPSPSPSPLSRSAILHSRRQIHDSQAREFMFPAQIVPMSLIAVCVGRRPRRGPQ